jgi:hypothetical protein
VYHYYAHVPLIFNSCTEFEELCYQSNLQPLISTYFMVSVFQRKIYGHTVRNSRQPSLINGTAEDSQIGDLIHKFNSPK